MQDNFEKAWRDKLGGYQAPADPQDWAAMTAMLDAKEDKRASFFWWGILALALLFTTGGIAYRYLSTTESGTGTAVANNTPNDNNGSDTENASLVVGNSENTSGSNTGGENSSDASTLANSGKSNTSSDTGTNLNSSSNNTNAATSSNGNGVISDATSSTTKQQNKGGKRKNKATDTNGSANDKAGNGIGSGSTANTAAAGTSKSSGRKGNGGKKATNNNTGNSNANQGNSSGNGIAGNIVGSYNGTRTSKGNGNGNGTATVSGTGGGTTATGTLNSPNTATYNEPVATLSLRQINRLPHTTALTFTKDTGDIKLKFAKPSKVSHYIGFGTGINNSRVDRSGDYSTGFNVGLQYTMMVKNRVGIHVGTAFRQYNYSTNLVACNYDIYQCPNGYTSKLQTIDLHVGAQVNLIKTNKVEWYVMGGMSNQFMLEETFEYDLPTRDTATPGQPIPVEPPRNTSFTGAGVSSFEESLSTSDAFNPTLGTNLDPTGEGKFLRERYLGAWYVGTGVTWNFAYRMNLQVEPTIGRSLQFVGIQDKKLWNTGVNVRLNVKLSR